MDLNIFTMYLALIMPGFLAEWIWEWISKWRGINNFQRLAGGLIFNLPILMINLFVLYTFKFIYTLSTLADKFTYVRFTMRYILLALVVSIVIGIIVGIANLILRKWKCKSDSCLNS